ncbi:hypothetical protein DSO57_1019322 [Entomophthora muscae]|uniref:Uncharacterized protein n=1 Tax=Entomophthora muscae TaxID=34485 RepID=A0ACC2TR94_9FUNG|nr:hypothetical protein DSO57_1019322 [Entomophthora muscae]
MELPTMPSPCGLVASPFSILITISYNKQYLILIILSFPIGLLSSPNPSTGPSLVQLQHRELFFITLSQENNFSYGQLMGFLYLITLEVLFEVSHEKDFLAGEVPDVTKEQLTELLNGWLANGPQLEFLTSLGFLVLGLFGSNFKVAYLEQVELPDFLNFCKVGSSNLLETNIVDIITYSGNDFTGVGP